MLLVQTLHSELRGLVAEVRCRPHNVYEAKLDYGKDFIERLIHQKRQRARSRSTQMVVPPAGAHSQSG